jgi:ABC-type bacteriocin/lantibiotic exporter with double-glycine peptidase domain
MTPTSTPKPKLKRVPVPTVLQMEAVECGAACLAMVLAYHGRIVPLEELRLACGVSRDGSKASNVVKAARTYGLKAKGFSLEPQQLLNLPLPLIIFWNFNHFVVVEGFGKNRVYINDPAVGRRTIEQEEFDQAFTGVTLVFEKGPDFVRGGQLRNLIGALRPRLAGARSGLAYVVLASLALVVPGLVVPALTRSFIDDYLIAGLTDWAWPLLVGLVLAALLTAVLTWLQQTTLLRLENRLALSSASTFFWHILRLPIEFFTQRFGGEIGARVGINDYVANLLSERLVTAIINALLVMNGLQMIETIKAAGAEADFFARWAGYLAKTETARQELNISTELLNLVPPVLTALNTALILGLGALQVMDGSMTIGMLVAFQTLAASFIGPVNTLVYLGGSLQDTQGYLDRLNDVLRYPVDRQRDMLGSVTLAETQPARFTGLYEPWDGQIRFDDQTRSATTAQVLHRSVAYVSQEVNLFEGTVRENLTLWDRTVSEQDLVQAAQDACIHEDVSARAGGYDGVVEEGGRNFSGGQRQRLEIARALINNPSVLVLDEATSALDPITEIRIDDALRRRGCTCLIIAHRLSTIRDCDEIIVLERGRVIQRGTHTNLAQVDGPYARLIAAE